MTTPMIGPSIVPIPLMTTMDMLLVRCMSQELMWWTTPAPDGDGEIELGH